VSPTRRLNLEARWYSGERSLRWMSQGSAPTGSRVGQDLTARSFADGQASQAARGSQSWGRRRRRGDDMANQILWGRGVFGKINLTCVGADARRSSGRNRRESMDLDKAASVMSAPPRAAQLRR
jgi:hypothetical protein